MKHAPALATFLMAAAGAAFAQTPAPAPAPAAPSAAAASVPPLKCEAPTLPGRSLLDDVSIRRKFDRDLKTYGDCMKAYVAERKTSADSLNAQAQANIEAGNKAVTEYNTLMQSFKEAQGQK